MPDDLGKELKRDYEKYQRLKNVGSGDGLGLGAILEYVFWTLAVISVAGMLVSMYFAGPGKPISGEQWLVGSMGSIGVFSLLAFLVRQIPEV